MAKGKFYAGIVHRAALAKSGAREFEPYSSYATEAAARRVAKTYVERLEAAGNAGTYAAAVKGPRVFYAVETRSPATKRDLALRPAKKRAAKRRASKRAPARRGAKKRATTARRDAAPRRSRTREEYLESIRYNQRDALEALQNAVGMRNWAAVKKYVAQLEKLDRQEYDATTARPRIHRVHEAMHEERYDRAVGTRETRAEREARMRRVGWKFPGGRT